MKLPPDASDMVLSDVDVLSPTDGWAVGHHAKGPPSPLKVHWDGARWRIVSDPDAGPSPSSLNAVSARSADDVWAVGYRRTSFNRFAPLSQHWDGSAWSNVSGPPVGDSSVLTDANADPTGVWAVGFSLSGSAYSPLVQRWDGTRWTTVPTPSLASDSGVLLSIESAGPLDAWAVGYRMNRWRYETLIEHWDGHEWSIVPSPNPAGNIAVLTGVAASTGRAWAVGYSTWGSTYRTLAQRWDGSRWEIVPSLDPHPKFNVFRDVIDGPGTGAWAVGSTRDGRRYGPLLEHWHGNRWDTKQIDGVSGILLGGSALETGHAVSLGHRKGHPLILGTCFGPSTTSVDRSADQRVEPESEDGQGDTEPVASTTSGGQGQEPAEAAAASSEVEGVVVLDEAVPAGISEQTETWGAAVTDLDNDGWSDFFLGRHGEAGRLYRNEEGRFVEVAPGTFSRSDRHGCVWIDWNRDRLDDLYCALGGARGYGIKANELWTQRADGGFTNRGPTLGVADPFGRGREAITLDANGDGLPDLFVANLETRLDGLPTPDRLFINTGKGFRMAPWFGLDVEDGGICATDGDVNNDGLADLLVCSRLSGLRIHENTGANRFIDISAEMEIPDDLHVRDAVFADFDSDSVLDLATVTLRRVVVRIQSNSVFKEVFRYEVAHGAAIAVGDVDADGYPDLYILQRGATHNVPDVLLLNDGTGTGFTEVSIPQAVDGLGGNVASLDYNRNGHADFVVLNGYQTPGGVQLLSSYPVPPEGVDLR